MHYVYVLYSKDDKKFYIGSAADIARRLNEHASGRCHTTLRFTNPEIVFYESFLSKIDALRREKYFKSTKGKRSLRLILKDTLTIDTSVAR